MTLRADAARNREAIVEAARAVFAEHGLDAPLDESAKQAGTGNATLYRRFPTRGDLVAAMQARYRGIADLVTMDVSSAPEIEELRSHAYDGLVQLVARAHEAGDLRQDFTDQDVVLLLIANAGLVERAHDIPAEAAARLIHLLLDGLRAQAATDG